MEGHRHGNALIQTHYHASNRKTGVLKYYVLAFTASPDDFAF